MSIRQLSTLFQSLTFHYSKDSEDYTTIKSIILSHGGTLVSVEDIAQIKLTNSESVQELEDGEYVDISYMYDCLEKQSVLSTDDYVVVPDAPFCIAYYRKLAIGNQPVQRMPESPSARVRSPPKKERLSTTPNSVTRTRFITRHDHYALPRGRTVYSEDEDVELIKFIMDRYKVGMSPNGQNLWKTAEREKLLNGLRSWQSMEGRWKKTLRVGWNKYLKIMERRGYVVEGEF